LAESPAGARNPARAAAVFVAALSFRTIDSNICAAFPTGTHFMWHVLAAAAVYLAMRAFTASLWAAPAQ
jgi:hypothetical protein